MNFEHKEHYSMQDLLKIMELLRSPEGCPWDKEQTHKSIRSNFLEETYEAVEAIDTDDSVLLQEELGDVLLQVLFHTQLEKEAGRFDFSDVVDGIAKKMVLRHPHVFGNSPVSSTEEVLENWDTIKMKSKQQASQTEVLQSVSKALPALMRCAKIQQKAEKCSSVNPDTEDALRKVERDVARLRNSQTCREAVGALLFSTVRLARALSVEPEQALSETCERFILQFSNMEQQAQRQDAPLQPVVSEWLDKF